MRLKQFSKRTISIILSVLLIFSTLMVGTISTANAATGTITVYFDNSNVNWSSVYVYFSQDMYFSGGVKSPGAAIQMTKISGTNVYVYTGNVTYGSKIAFSNSNMGNWNDFYGNKAAYRADFSTAKPCFKPNATSNETQNSTQYYSNGSWSTYTPPATKYTVTIGSSSNGTVGVTYGGTTKTSGTVSVTAGDKITLSNTPAAGYKFDNYRAGTSTVIKGNEYTVNSNVTITGDFSKETYNITDNSTNGSVVVKKGTSTVTTYQIDDQLTFTATPNDGYASNGKVTVNGKEYDSPYTVTVGESLINDITTSATFNVLDPDKEYSINYTAQDGVKVSYPATAKYNDTVTVEVDVDYGYTCTTVSVNGTPYTITDGKVTFTMPASNVTLTTNVEKENLTTEWDFYGYGNDRVAETDMNPADMIKGTMNGNAFAYYELNTTDTGDFRFMIGKNGTKYQHQSNGSQSVIEYSNTFGSDVTINNHGDTENYAKVNGRNTYYIVLYYANTDYGTWDGVEVKTGSKPIVCAYSDLPGDSYKDKFTVSIEQGKEDYFLSSASRGTSTLYTGKTSDKFEYTNNTVTFTTETKKITNSDLGVTDMFIYRVYGYSILITYKDGSKRVVSVDEKAISTPAKGTYSASYTFEPNEDGIDVKSAHITPIFTSSEEYAAQKGIGFTTLYLKATPGDNLFDDTYEPRYYTWRIVESGGGQTQSWVNSEKDGKKIQSLPEGWWNGQKMIYIGNGMYKAIVEDNILGITFVEEINESGATQTFDFSEFIKLQNLGYDQITFEPKKGVSGGVASGLNSAYGSARNKVYTRNQTNCSSYITSGTTKTNFELDVNIEGYYIDVFGNKLLDKSGNPISQAKLRAEMTGEINTSTEATALLAKMDTSKMTEQALYGARYGVVTEDDYYGMTYANRVYYFEVTGDQTYMVSQQVSGFGTIEGANSPKQSGVTNAVAYHNDNNAYMQYAQGTSETVSNFTTGYELIPADFKGVPYFVSYQYKVAPRIDGKWYYQDTIPMLPYEIKTGLMDSDDNLQVDSTTKTIIENNIGGTGIFSESGETTVSVESGKTTTAIATPNVGYKFVGFYEPNGTRLTTENNYVITVAAPGTVFAVFQPIEENTVVVTNNIYRGTNPKDGGGNGIVSVTLNVYSDEAGTNLLRTATGKNIAQLKVSDDEYFQWVITGVPTGVDTFRAFRSPDPDTGYYSKLDVQFEEDGYGYQYDDATEIHSYTSAMMYMDWSNYPNMTTLTIDNFTDFNKTSYIVDLHYKYKDRYNFDKTYIVTGIELTTEEMLNGYKPSAATIENNAPYIDEVFKDCTWDVNEDLSNVEQDSATYILVANQKAKDFITYIDNGVSEDLQKEVSPFNSTVYLEAPQSRVAKDKNGNDTIENFLYWKQYKTDANGNIIGDESEVNILSYYPRARVRVTFDSIIYAVFGVDTAPDFATSVKDPIYTREQYTENGVNFDYVYADLLLQYDISKTFGNGATFKEFFNDNIKFGIVLENNVGDVYAGGDLAGPSVTDSYNDTYVNNRDTLILKEAASLGSGDKKSSWSNGSKGSDDYNFYYNIYDLTNNVDNLTDLGRLDYIIRFANTEKNQGIVYNVYSYILYTNPETKKTTLYLSSPKVMNIYEIGNKTVDSNVTT